MLPSSTSSSSTSTRGNPRKRKRSAWSNDEDGSDNTVLLLDEMKDVNFEELATKYPEFAKEWKLVKFRKKKKSNSQSFSSFVTINFNTALTRAILHSRFNLVLPCLPEGRLVPPVPNRLWYVQWIKSHLLPLLSNTDYFQQPKESTSTTAVAARQKTLRCCRLRGIDIGTGASCIYPLLFCGGTCTYHHGGDKKKKNKQENSLCHNSCECQMVATDVDPISVESAKENINANKLDKQIQVVLVKPTNVQQQQQQQQQQQEQVTEVEQGTGPASTPLSSRTDGTKDVCYKNKGPIAHAMESITSSHHDKNDSVGDTDHKSFDIVMTNPPFYDDSESTERTDARAGDDRARVPMTVHEGSYPGGEVGFVLDMVRDSLSLRTSISWYTAMFGKKASFIKVKRILSQLLSPGNLQTTEFGPGQMTRWFLAWTYHQPTRTNPSSRIEGGLQKFEIKNVEQSASIKTTREAVDEIVNRICTHCQTIIPQATVECQNPPTGIDSTLSSCYTKIITVQHQGSTNPSSNFSHNESGSTSQSSSPLDVSLFPKRIFCEDNIAGILEFKRVLFKEVGNFRIDFTVSSTLAANANTDSHENQKATSNLIAIDAANEQFSVVVNLACFTHSIQGTEMIDKIRRQLVGEVSRTNRRWRRRQQKK